MSGPNILEGPAGALARASPAQDRAFLLAGRQARAHGNELRGAVALDVAPLRLELTPALGVAANVVASPFALRRERVGPGGLMLETIFTPVLGSVVVVQWTTPVGRGAAPAIECDWVLRAAPGGVAEATTLAATPTSAHPAQRREVSPLANGRISTASDAVQAIDTPAGAALLAAVSDPPTLIFTAARTRAECEAELRKIRSFTPLERRAEQIPSDWRRDFLATQSGDAGFDEGLEWAKVRARTPPLPWTFWGALGALTVGFERPAAELLKAWSPGSDANGHEPSAELGLLAARFAQWSGLGPLAAGGGRGADAVERKAVEALLREVERGAVADVEASRGKGRRLPLLGGASPLPRLEELALGVPTRGDSATAADRAYEVVARALEQGMSAGGVWAGAQAPLICAALLHGVLGARADVLVGRVHLAPCVPRVWEDVRVTGIRAGDALIRMHYRRGRGAHDFVLAQDSGRIPLMLVFEPDAPAPGGGPARVLVDGEPAELDVTSESGRTRTRVQLPLDFERRVTLVAE